jgi:hypothetical protein
MTLSESTTIQTLILADLVDSGRTTASKQSRRWGEDAVRCKFWLEQFHREGLCSKKSRKPTKRNLRSLTVDAFTYVADKEKIQAKLRELIEKASQSH